MGAEPAERAGPVATGDPAVHPQEFARAWKKVQQAAGADVSPEQRASQDCPAPDEY